MKLVYSEPRPKEPTFKLCAMGNTRILSVFSFAARITVATQNTYIKGRYGSVVFNKRVDVLVIAS